MRNGSRVCANSVPLVSDTWRLQWLHRHTLRRVRWQWPVWSQSGQRNPSRQRALAKASRQLLFGAVTVEEAGQAHVGLKLHEVLLHDASPSLVSGLQRLLAAYHWMRQVGNQERRRNCLSGLGEGSDGSRYLSCRDRLPLQSPL